jgi:Cu(I)/Ag(I) efflux system membrane protein CusA/SilA
MDSQSRLEETTSAGSFVARTGVNTKAVIEAVKTRIEQVAPGLPDGVTIVPFHDRSRSCGMNMFRGAVTVR